VSAIGYLSDKLEDRLDFPYDMSAGRATRTEAQLRADITRAFKEQSHLGTHPNSVSANWQGVIIDPEEAWPKRIRHEDLEEVEALKVCGRFPQFL
jgi:hypothetical protein